MRESTNEVAAAPAAGALQRGRVIEVQPDSIRVAVEGIEAPVSCELLYVSADAREPQPGDAVLVLVERVGLRPGGIILGCIGKRARAQSGQEEDGGAPEILHLQATQELTLRVGDGSITIRADGKILIRGTDLVSHAKRTNRIKGGAVSIN
jgi:hypothetical protein